VGVGIRLAIAGGGTGGHVFPMLAVARAIEREAPGSELLFVGTRRGIEARLVPEAGYRLATLRIGGLKGKSALRRLATLAQLPWAVLASAMLLARFRPQAVLGGGGFASGPVGLAASLLRTPLALLEVSRRWVCPWLSPTRRERSTSSGCGAPTARPAWRPASSRFSPT